MVTYLLTLIINLSLGVFSFCSLIFGLFYGKEGLLGPQTSEDQWIGVWIIIATLIFDLVINIILLIKRNRAKTKLLYFILISIGAFITPTLLVYLRYGD